MTPFILAMNLAAWSACAAAWIKGGHPERLGATVLLSAAVIELFIVDWRLGELEAGIAGTQMVLLAIFAGIGVRSERWWPLAATACLVLLIMVHLLTLLTPLSIFAAMSARVGLWLLLHVIVLAGVAERWLAGEGAVCRISPAPAATVGQVLRAGAA
jgi:hypothetical protein